MTRKSYITVYQSFGGWKAVMLCWSPEGFWEPYQTGVGVYRTKMEAEQEAEHWAADEEIEYKP